MKYPLNTDLQELAEIYLGHEEKETLRMMIGCGMDKLQKMLKGRTLCTDHEIDCIQAVILVRHQVTRRKVKEVYDADE